LKWGPVNLWGVPQTDTPMMEAAAAETSLKELALLFLRLGTTAFGGPAAHIAMMHTEVVVKRRWLSEQEFLDMLGAVNLIPGPNSTEMAIHVGHARRGWPGLLVSGTCFIVPAAIMVSLLAWAYVRFRQLPQTAAVFYGVKPVVVAVVLQALITLGRKAVKTPLLAICGLIATALALFEVNELLILLGAGCLLLLVELTRQRDRPQLRSFAAMPGLWFAGAVAAAAKPFGLWPMFLFFLKTGSVLFGSGYVLLAFLRNDLVYRWHWLTEGQLLDAIAVGQLTPGPLFTTATFIGYLLGGAPGAFLATLGIFLPAFVFVAISGPLVPRLRKSKLCGAFLDGVNVASLALMFAVLTQIARAGVVDWATLAIAAVCLVLLYWKRVNVVWLMTAGCVAGLVLRGI
jgi:chromate transporter